MPDATTPDDLPFSRSVRVENMGEVVMHFTLKADETQQRALARFLDVVAVDRLEAQLSVQKWKRRGILVEGNLIADVVQECVVTLEPVPEHIEAPIRARYLPEADVLALEAEQSVEAYLNDPEDPPEPYDEKLVDIGMLVIEFLALELNPYPRAPDAELQQP